MSKGNYYKGIIAQILLPVTDSEIQRTYQYPEEEAYNERLALGDIKRESGWNERAMNEVKFELSF